MPLRDRRIGELISQRLDLAAAVRPQIALFELAILASDRGREVSKLTAQRSPVVLEQVLCRLVAGSHLVVGLLWQVGQVRHQACCSF